MNQILDKNNNLEKLFPWGQIQIIICHHIAAKIYNFYRHNRNNPNAQYYRSLRSFFKELNPEFAKLPQDKQEFYFNYIEHYRQEVKDKYLEDIKKTLNFCWRSFTMAISKMLKSELEVSDRKWDSKTKRLVWILPYMKNKKDKAFWDFLSLFKCWKTYQKRIWNFENEERINLTEWKPPPTISSDDKFDWNEVEED